MGPRSGRRKPLLSPQGLERRSFSGAVAKDHTVRVAAAIRGEDLEHVAAARLAVLSPAHRESDVACGPVNEHLMNR